MEPVANHVEHVIDEDSLEDILSNNNNVIIDFFANWCKPCMKLKPYYYKIASEYPNIKFVEINVDFGGDIADEYNISKFPSIVFIHNKEVISDHLIGCKPDELRVCLDKLY
jgi:thioredoxin 1